MRAGRLMGQVAPPAMAIIPVELPRGVSSLAGLRMTFGSPGVVLLAGSKVLIGSGGQSDFAAELDFGGAWGEGQAA